MRAATTLACLMAALGPLASALEPWPLQALRIRLAERSGSALSESSVLTARADTDPALLYPEYYLRVPIDHFHNDSTYAPHRCGTFPLRYWFDASNYKPGGPVIMLSGGETSGKGRLPFLQKGIVAQLTQATGGVGVILEHRYYGNSFPTANLTTENLRFLTTDQALADTAFFAKNIVFPGLEHLDLRAGKAPWIAYGGSYAGGFVAFLRKLYPDVFFGAISSSGVTEAIVDFWRYFDAQRKFAPELCVKGTQHMVDAIDNIFIDRKGTEWPQKLKSALGMGTVTYDDDVACALATGIWEWQGLNWDPAINNTWMGRYCDDISTETLRYPELEGKREAMQQVMVEAGYPGLTNQMLNVVGFMRDRVGCIDETNQDQCFGTHNASWYYNKNNSNYGYLGWAYQFCTQWGYYQTGSGAPPDMLPLMSRTVDVPYSSIVCREAFNITTPPDVEAINKYGGFNISYPRLAIIDGEADPWIEASPHAYSVGIDRPSTTEEPFLMIGGKAVHHWDENGIFPNETTASLPPKPVRDTQAAMAEFVKEWLKDWPAA